MRIIVEIAYMDIKMSKGHTHYRAIGIFSVNGPATLGFSISFITGPIHHTYTIIEYKSMCKKHDRSCVLFMLFQ